MFGKLVGNLFGGGKPIVDSVVDAIDVFVETDEDRREDKVFKERMAQLKNQIQTDINLQDAKSDKWWKAGARPAWIWGALFIAIWITLSSTFGFATPPPEIVDFWFWIALSLLGIRSGDKALAQFNPTQATKLKDAEKRVRELEEKVRSLGGTP